MLLYNGILLPKLPSWDSTTYKVSAISRVESGASAQFAGAQYILVLGASIMWQNSKCYVSNITGVYRFNGSAWVWHYGSGTTYTQDIVASGFFEAVWTNTTIPTADGSGVYLAASLPVDPNAPEEPDEPEEPEEPVAPVDAAKIFRRGWMSGFVTGLNVRAALVHKVIEEPDEPTTAANYLYGTPSESGNVAIAEGEGYVVYNGAVLPKLPDEILAYLYRAIAKSTSTSAPDYCWVYGLPSPLVSYEYSQPITGIKIPYCHMEADAEYRRGGMYPTSSSFEWTVLNSTDTGNVAIKRSEIIWANHDIPNLDGSVYMAASDPIPLASSEPVGYTDDNIPIYEQKE